MKCKKIISIVLAMLVLTSIISINTVSAENSTVFNEKLTFQGTGNKREVSREINLDYAKRVLKLRLTAASVPDKYANLGVRFLVTYVYILDDDGIVLYSGYAYKTDGDFADLTYYIPDDKKSITVKFVTNCYDEDKIPTLKCTAELHNSTSEGEIVEGATDGFQRYRFLTGTSDFDFGCNDSSGVFRERIRLKNAQWSEWGKYVSSFNIYIKDKSGNEVFKDYWWPDSDAVYDKYVYLKNGEYSLIIYYNGATAELNSTAFTFDIKLENKQIKTLPTTPKLTLKSTRKQGYYSVKMNWKDNPDYDVVELWSKRNSGKWKKIKTVKNSAYWRYTGFTCNYYNNDFDYYKIIAYKKGLNCEVSTKWSNVVSIKKIETPKFTVKSGKKKANLKITKPKTGKVSSYEVWMSTNSKKGFKKVSTKRAGKFATTVSKLKSRKTYYFKIRFKKNIGKDVQYSSFSSVKKIKTK